MQLGACGVWKNIPNYITLVRLVLIPFFINLMIYDYYPEAFIVFLIAGLTDAIDGLTARLTKTQSELGAFLDPLADKLLIVSAFVTLVLLDKLPVWLVIIVVSRDIILALGSLVLSLLGHRLKIRPSPLGKATTVMQLLVIAITLVIVAYGIEMRIIDAAYWIATALTIASGMQYVVRGMRIVGQHEGSA